MLQKNIKITDHLLENIFLTLPDKFKKIVTKEKIKLILNLKSEYNSKANENMVNETAFMALEDYIKQEAELEDGDLSVEAIKSVLNAEELYFFF